MAKYREATQSKQTFASSWNVYIRGVLRPLYFYTVSALDANTFFYVGESKSFAGKQLKEGDDEQGRSIAISWFTFVCDGIDGIVVERSAAKLQGLTIELYTLANILRRYGYELLAVAPDATERHIELQLEASF